jgi:hypothetical protein
MHVIAEIPDVMVFPVHGGTGVAKLQEIPKSPKRLERVFFIKVAICFTNPLGEAEVQKRLHIGAASILIQT